MSPHLLLKLVHLALALPVRSIDAAAAEGGRMGDPILFALVIGVIVTVGAWVLAARGGRLTGMPIARGLGHGLVVAVLIGAVPVVLATIGLNGLEFFGVTINLATALMLGLLAGGAVALGVFVLGVALMPLGLLVRPSAMWTTLGTWLAVPLAALALAAAYYGYRSVIEQIEAPAIASGTVTFDITGRSIAHATGRGQAECTTFDDGTFRVDAGGAFWFQAGAGAGSTLETDDGRPASIQLIWPAEGEVGIAISIGERGADSGFNERSTLSLAAGSTQHVGSVDLEGIRSLDSDGEPDESDPWNGSVSWSCASR